MGEWVQENKFALVGLVVLLILLAANYVVRANRAKKQAAPAAAAPQVVSGTDAVPSSVSAPAADVPETDQNLIGENEKAKLEDFAKQLDSLPEILKIPPKISTYTPTIRNPFWWEPVKALQEMETSSEASLVGLFKTEEKTYALFRKSGAVFLLPIGENVKDMPFQLLTNRGRIVIEEQSGKSFFMGKNNAPDLASTTRMIENPPNPLIGLFRGGSLEEKSDVKK
ncbi:MAG: hypothetical protein HQM10_19205 [Candidatus Riflebacteria bacterium]|nr:hypothetical protein [Candidatus Riflebacteria bacterium]